MNEIKIVNGRAELGGMMFLTSDLESDLGFNNMYTFLKGANGQTTKEEMDRLFHTLTEQEKADALFDYDCAVKGGGFFAAYTGERYYDKHLDNKKGDN